MVAVRKDVPDDFRVGLAIGFTRADPARHKPPTEPFDVPDSYSLGYDGVIFLDDGADPGDIDWQPDRLKKGDRVGLVLDQDLLVLFVNGEVVHDAEAIKPKLAPGLKLWAFVGLIGTALEV